MVTIQRKFVFEPKLISSASGPSRGAWCCDLIGSATMLDYYTILYYALDWVGMDWIGLIGLFWINRIGLE